MGTLPKSEVPEDEKFPKKGKYSVQLLTKSFLVLQQMCNICSKTQGILVGYMGVRRESNLNSLEKQIHADGKRKEFQERFDGKRFRKRNYRKK